MKEVIKPKQKLRCEWIYKQETLNFIICRRCYVHFKDVLAYVLCRSLEYILLQYMLLYIQQQLELCTHQRVTRCTIAEFVVTCMSTCNYCLVYTNYRMQHQIFACSVNTNTCKCISLLNSLRVDVRHDSVGIIHNAYTWFIYTFQMT